MSNEQDNSLLYYLHIPKTAGGTLLTILDNYFDQSEIFPAYVMSDLLQTSDLLARLGHTRLLRGHFDYTVIGLFNPDRPIQIITMLRNPLDRTLSQLEHSLRDPTIGYWNYDELASLNSSISDFLHSSAGDAFLGNVQTRSLVSEWYGISRLKLWDTALPIAPDDLLLELAKKRLLSCTFIGIQERFEDSLRLLCFTLKFYRPRAYQNRNVGYQHLRPTQLPKQDIERLNAINGLDNQLYQYGLTLFESRFQDMMSYLKKTYPEYQNVDEQIDANYRQTRPRQQLSASTDRYWRFNFSQPLYGINWYPRESFEGGWFRWIGPELHSMLEWEIVVNGNAEIEIGSLGAISQEIQDSFQVQVNDYLIPLMCSTVVNGLIFTGNVPLTAFQEHFQVLHFKVSKTLCPYDMQAGSSDRRALGIRLTYIELKLLT